MSWGNPRWAWRARRFRVGRQYYKSCQLAEAKFRETAARTWLKVEMTTRCGQDEAKAQPQPA